MSFWEFLARTCAEWRIFSLMMIMLTAPGFCRFGRGDGVMWLFGALISLGFALVFRSMETEVLESVDNQEKR